jgi:pimeloyl-ACP methyl ester carboxylesterase
VSARHSFIRDGTRLSYVDFGGDGRPLLALHGHAGCGRNFAPVAAALAPAWRVVALDQRGHGWSHRPKACDRAAYVGDAEAFLVHLDLGPVPVLGHSLGGVNAYQLAARRPDLVSALLIEDVGARVGPPPAGEAPWPRRFESVTVLLGFLHEYGGGLDRYFLDSLVEYEDGWGFRFDPAWVARSRDALTGDWSADWLASSCPALLLRGRRSHVLPAQEARRMAAERPNTRLVEFDAGHTIHDERPEEFTGAVADFMAGLLSGS